MSIQSFNIIQGKPKWFLYILVDFPPHMTEAKTDTSLLSPVYSLLSNFPRIPRGRPSVTALGWSLGFVFRLSIRLSNKMEMERGFRTSKCWEILKELLDCKLKKCLGNFWEIRVPQWLPTKDLPNPLAVQREPGFPFIQEPSHPASARDNMSRYM